MKPHLQKSSILLVSVVAVISSFGPPAAAEGTREPFAEQRAEALFRRALELMDEGRHARACPMLEESRRLDPAMGTAFRLAECYEHTERLGEAFMLYQDVAAQARRRRAEDRAEVARARLAALGPRVAVVNLIVPDEALKEPDLSITWDEREIERTLWNAGIVVTTGAHVLEAAAPGKRPFRREVVVGEVGTLVDVEVPPLADERTRQLIVLHPEPLPRPMTLEDRRWLALGALVVGLGGLTMASIAGLSTSLETSGTAGDLDPGGASMTNATAIAGMSLAGVGLFVAGSLWTPAPAGDVRFAITPGPGGGAGVVQVSF
ncbi:bacterial transcriptional activator domain-containing protein [Polyangium sorediatum]|uniref:Tetratricopeptide repeat protein n=1 Tax=Polyangium sorediatum TaxID=889274 RepID=A0ABT6P2H9_9BACT|nr:bacterial transcriptional activator domain-containing protein [Polyangium sorediatum]MDI1434768.1 hypothetical protein [Polyangium sorediatum]